MSLFRFSKLPKSKPFTFTPRYYDPIQDELEERAKQREMRKQDDLEGAKMRIRSGFKSKYNLDYGIDELVKSISLIDFKNKFTNN